MKHEDFLNGLETLKKNEWYWLIDNNYNQYYKDLFDDDCHDWEHKYGVMCEMLYASKQIFG